MNGASSGVHDPRDISIGRANADSPSEEVAGIETTSGVNAKVPLVVDVADEKADLVHMGHEQDFGGLCGRRLSGSRPGMPDGKQGPHGVDGNFVEQAGRRDLVPNHGTDAFFAAGNGGSLGEQSQEFHEASL